MDALLSPLLTRPRTLADLLAFARFIVVGANSGGDQVARWLREHGKTVVAFTDLAPALQGTMRDGLPVLAPADCLTDDLADAGTAFVIGTVRQKDAADLLTGPLGVDPFRVFPFVNPMFAEHYAPGAQDAVVPHHGRIRACLSDDASRAYFDRVTAFYGTLDPRHLAPQPRRIGQYGYDAPGANPRPGAVIVDCGAFTGDTVPDFLAATGGECRVHALEAFAPNFDKLTTTIAAQGWQGVVNPLPLAVAREKGVIAMGGDDSIADGCAGIGLGARQVQADTLDNLFLDLPVDYLKMDIEGAEMDALEGGRRMLEIHRPVVAVAAYHKPGHIVEIADFLLSALGPCRLYAAHDPAWVFHIHYVCVPRERG